ncbi:unnamed protein product [Coccothraustes coccothraustes]
MPRLSSALAVTQHHGTALQRGPFASTHQRSGVTPSPPDPQGAVCERNAQGPCCCSSPAGAGQEGSGASGPRESPQLGLQSSPERGRRSPAAPGAEGRTADTDLCWWRLGAACGGGVAIATCQTPALRATAAAPGGQRCAGTRYHTLVPSLCTGDGAGATGHTQRCAATCPELGMLQQNIKC